MSETMTPIEKAALALAAVRANVRVDEADGEDALAAAAKEGNLPPDTLLMDMFESLSLCVELLDSLRIDHGVGRLLAPAYRENYQAIAEQARGVLRRARGEQEEVQSSG